MARQKFDIEHLYPRQLDILAMIADGRQNSWIASELYISRETVKDHISTILRALNARNRTHAVAIALRHGIIE